jgi:ribosomal protein S18 acetylase RimI-like enzyme
MIESQIGNLAQVLRINETIPERDIHFSREYFEEFLIGKESIIVIGYDSEKPVGFIIGFINNNKQSFNTWVSGVNPEHRGKGVLRSMNQLCEEIVKLKGLNKIISDVALRRTDMIMAKIKLGYKVIGFQAGEDLPNSRLFFEKVLETI